MPTNIHLGNVSSNPLLVSGGLLQGGHKSSPRGLWLSSFEPLSYHLRQAPLNFVSEFVFDEIEVFVSEAKVYPQLKPLWSDTHECCLNRSKVLGSQVTCT